MIFSMSVISGLSAGIAFLLGLIRLRKIDPVFFPFIVLMGTGLANELISLWLINRGVSNSVSFNIYLLLSSLLLGLQFKNWNLFSGKHYVMLLTALATTWIIELVVTRQERLYYSWFIIGQCVVIILLSTEQVSKVVASTGRRLLYHPVFLICTGLLIFYTYSLLVEIFWLYGLNKTHFFRNKIYQVLIYINLFTNLLYAYAILWIPLKRKYIMGY